MGATCNLYTGWRGGDRGVHSGGAAAHGAAGGARGGVPVGRAERGGGDAEPERHEQAGGAQALVALLLLRPRAAAEHPQEVARQEGERRRRAGRLRRSVQGQLRGHARQVRRLRRRGRRRLRELVRQGVQVLAAATPVASAWDPIILVVHVAAFGPCQDSCGYMCFTCLVVLCTKLSLPSSI